MAPRRRKSIVRWIMKHICEELSCSLEHLSQILFFKQSHQGSRTQVMLDYYSRAVLMMEEEKMPEVGYSRHLRDSTDP